MKETYRLQKFSLQKDVEHTGKQMAVFFIYVGKEIPEFLLVDEKMIIALKRLQKIVHEKNTTNM